MSSAAEEVPGIRSMIHDAIQAVHEGRENDLPQARYPENIWPSDDAPQYMWTAMSMWHKWSSGVISRHINDGIRRPIEEAFAPPIAETLIGWWRDMLHDEMFREYRDYLPVWFLECAIRADDAEGIRKGMSVVLDKAGGGWPPRFRLDATRRAIQATNKSWREGKLKDNCIAYMRAYVARDTKTAFLRHKYGSSKGPGHHRLSSEFLDRPTGYQETPRAYRDGSSGGGEGKFGGMGRSKPLSPEALGIFTRSSPEVILLKKEEREESERTLKLISECSSLGEKELMDLLLDEIPAAEAERDLGMRPGTWRNLRKRIRRKYPQRPPAPPKV